MGNQASVTNDATNIYRSLGVEPIINCRGTFTIIGGSVERPEVLAAMEAAAGSFVQYDELAAAVGQRLAAVTGAEWGLITAGCAAGLKHVTAACVTGGNPEKLVRIPDLRGLDKTQVIAPAYSRNTYDHAVRNIGVEMITVNTAAELEQAINPRTAMVYLCAGGGSAPGQPLSLEVIASVARPRGIPILVDAAAEDLTIPCVHLAQGADVVAYSGGKALCGPQCAGLLLGNKAVLMSAWQASSPHHGPGRDDKIGKEEIVGMLAAVEAWVTRNHAAEWETWCAWLDIIAQRAAQVNGVTTRVQQPTGLSNRAPMLIISWDPQALHITGEEVAEDFARRPPRLAVGGYDGADRASITIAPNQMQPGQADVVAERVHAILALSRPPRPTCMEPPAADLGGLWQVTVRYFSSTSQHQFDLQQDGNWIAGVHRSDFSSQEIRGQIEGDQIRLRSDARQTADNVPFMFSGQAKGDAIEGTIHLGEYLTAGFTACRQTSSISHARVTVPGGPPLAT
jgi:seryl-tRNA(Sec) selenium transferase